jgi:hypothetical protein
MGSKALQVGYRDKLRMVALTKQVSHGPYNASTMPAVGLFDVVGNDRRLVIKLYNAQISVKLHWQLFRAYETRDLKYEVYIYQN